MRNLNAALRMHPALPVMMSVGGLVVALCWAIFSAQMNAAYSPDADSSSEEFESLAVKFAWQLGVGRPWLALAVGTVIGCVVFYLEKRKLRARIDQVENVERLVRWFLLPAPERRKQQRVCWKPFGLSLAWQLRGVIAALLLGCLLQFSLNVCLPSLFIPWALLYPEYKCIRDEVYARLTNPEVVGVEAAYKWVTVRRRTTIAIIAIVVFFLCVTACPAFRLARMGFEIRADVEEARHSIELLDK